MNKLKKIDLTAKTNHVSALRERFDELTQAVTDYNEGSDDDTWSAVDQAQRDYNKAVTEANTFISGIHDRLEEYYEEKSEPWQESDAGDTYKSFMEAWELELSESELTRPENDGTQLDNPDAEEIDQLEELPDSKDEV